jgi:predicted nucleic acid-binding protein
VRSFVDTNVWVYALDPADPAKQATARRLLAREAQGLVVSPQVMGELYVTLTRRGRPAMDAATARIAVRHLGDLCVVPLEVRDVVRALELSADGQLAYWDALIVASARAAGCERLLTEDLAHGAVIDGVRIENPFRDAAHRLSEPRSAYARGGEGAWTDANLREALGAYEAACRAAGMRQTAVHSYWDYARRFLDWRTGTYPRHATVRPVPDRPVGIDTLRAQAETYRRACEELGLSVAAVTTYARHARFFVRWLAGEFTPGERLGRRALRKPGG